MKASRSWRFQASCCVRRTCSTSAFAAPSSVSGTRLSAKLKFAAHNIGKKKVKYLTNLRIGRVRPRGSKRNKFRTSGMNCGRTTETAAGSTPREKMPRTKVKRDERKLRFKSETYELSPALLGGHGLNSNSFAGSLPRALRPIHRRALPVFDTVVMIRLAHRAQGFVIEAGESEPHL